ncbi:MAG: methyltransferase [bacterium]
MKTTKPNVAKDLYKELRRLPWQKLWGNLVPAFNCQDAGARAKNAALVRAVGVVFVESGFPADKPQVAAWLRSLLKDPDEKIRRYAMAALPKIGAESTDEAALIHLLRTTHPDEREKKHLSRALDKIGGQATLAIATELSAQTTLKVRATLARKESPSEILLESRVDEPSEVTIHLRCRRGLEGFVREEIEKSQNARGLFDVLDSRQGLVAIQNRVSFQLSDLLDLRCFATLGFVLGYVKTLDSHDIATRIAAARTLFQKLTRGAIRYRIDFPSLGHQRALVHDMAIQTYSLCPDILNDARSAPWAVEIQPDRGQFSIELRPRLSPDPRFSYRRQDVPAASHPPLAACMARLAGNSGQDVVWDPFCGSGLELIERGLVGGVRRLIGSDRSLAAIDIARANLQASGLELEADFFHGDFRDAAIKPNSVTQMITNPPMGRRVPILDLPELINDLFQTAAAVLRPGGILVLANPLPTQISNKRLRLDSSQRMDLGGFDVRLERHVKLQK